MTCNLRHPMGIFLYREREACFWCHTETSNPLRFEKIELLAKLLDYFVWSNKSNIHQCMCGWWGRSVYVLVMGTTTKGMWIWIQQRKWKMCDTKNKQYVISSQNARTNQKHVTPNGKYLTPNENYVTPHGKHVTPNQIYETFIWCHRLHSVAECCSTLQCVAVRCSVLHCLQVCVTVIWRVSERETEREGQRKGLSKRERLRETERGKEKEKERKREREKERA